MSDFGLKNKNLGFTLIELLVVIAIIAILVVIVIVAINPIQRLADSANQRASSNVRNVATGVQACITNSNSNASLCDTAGELSPNYISNGTTICFGSASGAGPCVSSSIGSNPNRVSLTTVGVGSAMVITLCQQGQINGTPMYAKWVSSNGRVTLDNTACP